MTDLPGEVNITMSIGFPPPAQNVFVLYKESCRGPGSILTKMFSGSGVVIFCNCAESHAVTDLYCQVKVLKNVLFWSVYF